MENLNLPTRDSFDFSKPHEEKDCQRLITQLYDEIECKRMEDNKMSRVGPQTTFNNRGVVMPRASKKDLDLVMQVKLKKALVILELEFTSKSNKKQVFCEALIKENRRLRKLLEEVNDEKENEVLAIRKKLDEAIGEDRILRELFEKNESLLLDYGKEIQKLVEEKNALMKEFTESQKTRESEYSKIAQKIEKLSKENTEYKKKCDGFFHQVVSMISRQKESEEELDQMKQAFDHQTTELDKCRQQELNNLIPESLNDYKDEDKFKKLFDEAQQDCERTKCENQSHMATIRHLENELERMKNNM